MKKLFLIFILIVTANVTIFAKDTITWKKLGISDSQIKDWKKIGIKTPLDAKEWTDEGIHNTFWIKGLKKVNIKASEYKNYSKIKELKQIQLLKELNMKPNNLIAKMLNYFDFNNKDSFKKAYNNLKDNGCKKIENNYFSYADIYDNEGLCYIFNAKLFQRLDRRTGLAQSKQSRKLFFVTFNKSWSEGNSKYGIIKGQGNFTYDTSGGTKKNVSKGLILY
jgi:hypothetical protein